MAFIFLYVAIIEVLNPQMTGFLNIRKFENWTTNIEYVKFKNIGKVEDVETIILGSSTSEAYHASDVDQIFGTKSYALSLGGADTPTRYIFLKRSLEKFKSLKRIIYVADFFEFNKNEAKPAVAFNQEMGSSLPDYAKPHALNFIKYYLNHQLLEDAFNVLKRKKKNKTIKLGSDGTTSRSMVLSSIQVQNGVNAIINEAQKKKLMEYIVENYITYSRSVLNKFIKLNPVVIHLYKEMLELAASKNVEIIFILSPYQKDFRDKLMTIEGIEALYENWQNLLSGLAKQENIKLVNPTRSFIATEPMSGAWRDGIHYGRESAFSFMKEALAQESNGSR